MEELGESLIRTLNERGFCRVVPTKGLVTFEMQKVQGDLTGREQQKTYPDLTLYPSPLHP